MVAATTVAQLSSLVTSSGSNRAAAPIAAATSPPSRSSTSAITTLAPSRAKRRAVAAPMPDAAPETIATLFANLMDPSRSVVPSLMEGATAIDGQCGAGDERGLGACEEQDSVGDLERFGNAFQCIGARIAWQALRHRRVHHARADAVDANAGSQFGRQSTRQVHDPALRSSISRHAGRIGQQTLTRGDVDDCCTRCPAEPRQSAAHGDVDAGQVHIDHPAPLGDADLEHSAVQYNAGAVDDAVNAARLVG